MIITGITAEYNPFHNGHAYMIGEARRITGCDAVVVAMSGDFVQRGEPAVTDKWIRTSHALANGADLVIEIPALFCLGNAGQYASAGVRLLEAAGCTHIAFGSECGDIGRIRRTAEQLTSHEKEIEACIAAYIKDGLNYPAARARAYGSLDNDTDINTSGMLSGPNDVLAIEYVKNMKCAEPVAVRRLGAGYNEGYNKSCSRSGIPSAFYQSASAIREMIHEGADIRPFVPGDVYDYLLSARRCSGHLTFPDEWLDILKYAVMSVSPDEIDDCPSGGEGLGNLLKKEVMRADSLESLILAVKSRRYTYTRISRLCMQVILGITRSRYPYSTPEYIRVLGFNEKGRNVLAGLRSNRKADETGDGSSFQNRAHDDPLPVITNINKNAAGLSGNSADMLSLDIHSADIYNLITHRDIISESDHIIPVIRV